MTGAAPFVLDLASNPHDDLLALGLETRRIARANLGNLTAQASLLMFLRACSAATGEPVDRVAAWLEHHDPARPPTVNPAGLSDEVIDAAVRARRVARLATADQLPVYRYWQGMSDLLALLLDCTPAEVDALIAACDPVPAPDIAEVPVAVSSDRVDPVGP